MKIALIGLCQVVGMGDALRALLPEAEVHAYHVTQHDQRVEDFLINIKGFDLIVTQILPIHNMPGLELEALSARGLENLQFVPPLVFGGFHPDAAIIMKGPAQLESPIESFHSRILAAAFLISLPLDRAVRLFNTFTYARLGYLEMFEAASEEFGRHMADYGLGELVDRSWAGWLAPGPFMLTPLHPRVRVLAGFATEAAKRVGLVDAAAAAPEGVVDALESQHAWPVYPGIAERIGVPGSLVFTTYASAVSSEAERELSLEMFARRSFDIYDANRDALEADSSVVRASEVLRSFVR